MRVRGGCTAFCGEPLGGSLAHEPEGGAAGKAVIYQWESRKRQPSPVFWTRIDQLRADADAAGREARDAAPRP